LPSYERKIRKENEKENKGELKRKRKTQISGIRRNDP
jgi:hypothetical protein